MWRYFWSYETDLPPDIGVELFGTTHLTWVAIALLLIVLVCLIYRRLTPPARRRLQLTLAILMTGGYVLKWIWALLIHHYELTEMLPLHLCGLSAWLELGAVLGKRPFLKEFGYACSLPGAAFTFITPGMGPYPLLHFYYIQFILAHTILLLLPILWVWGDGYRPDYRRLPRVFAFLLLLAGIAVVVNWQTGSNYMFLNYAPESTPLKPLADFFGNPGYQAAMAGLLFLIWVAEYVPWAVSARRHHAGTGDAMKGQPHD